MPAKDPESSEADALILGSLSEEDKLVTNHEIYLPVLLEQVTYRNMDIVFRSGGLDFVAGDNRPETASLSQANGVLKRLARVGLSTECSGRTQGYTSWTVGQSASRLGSVREGS
jgi:hypothetical protein